MGLIFVVSGIKANPGNRHLLLHAEQWWQGGSGGGTWASLGRADYSGSCHAFRKNARGFWHHTKLGKRCLWVTDKGNWKDTATASRVQENMPTGTVKHILLGPQPNAELWCLCKQDWRFLLSRNCGNWFSVSRDSSSSGGKKCFPAGLTQLKWGCCTCAHSVSLRQSQFGNPDCRTATKLSVWQEWTNWAWHKEQSHRDKGNISLVQDLPAFSVTVASNVGCVHPSAVQDSPLGVGRKYSLYHQ